RLVVILEALGQLFDIFRRPAWHFHAKMQAHLRQDFLDLVKRFTSEIRRTQHFGFALLHEVSDVHDVVVFQTIGRAHGQFELVHFLEEGRIECQVRYRFGRSLLAGLLEVDEYVELILENSRSIGQRVLWRHCAIGFDGHGQLVVVKYLTFASILDLVGDLAHRRIKAVDRDEANRGILRAVTLGRHVALAGIYGELHSDLGALVEGAQHEVRVEHDNVADGLDVAGGDGAGPLLLYYHPLGAFALHLDGDVLDVEHHVGDVLAHTGDRGKLMQYAVDVHGLHRCALQ